MKQWPLLLKVFSIVQISPVNSLRNSSQNFPAVKDIIFLFNGKTYLQIDGVGMGNPLGPTFANLFLCFHENNWLQNCPLQFKPKLS